MSVLFPPTQLEIIHRPSVLLFRAQLENIPTSHQKYLVLLQKEHGWWFSLPHVKLLLLTWRENALTSCQIYLVILSLEQLGNHQVSPQKHLVKNIQFSCHRQGWTNVPKTWKISKLSTFLTKGWNERWSLAWQLFRLRPLDMWSEHNIMCIVELLIWDAWNVEIWTSMHFILATGLSKPRLNHGLKYSDLYGDLGQKLHYCQNVEHIGPNIH